VKRSVVAGATGGARRAPFRPTLETLICEKTLKETEFDTSLAAGKSSLESARIGGEIKKHVLNLLRAKVRPQGGISAKGRTERYRVSMDTLGMAQIAR
jgi:hypothetical protein